MAHPKSRVSKQRKRKRRTHKKVQPQQIHICKVTNEPHLYHHAYYHNGDLYYRGMKVIEDQSLKEI
ncbi:MAG: 50S ribosomal protein L32 [Saprospiraceae bacterium]|jgi:large subunit ribosomal protein L32|nr:50S ribosomal protein L32 [Saprospiraceae bacterium]